MKKHQIKGLSAFELLEGLDDGMILSASLPEAAPAVVPTKGERIAAFFSRMGKGGMAAAIATVAVALAVLLGVVLAGRMGTVDPPDTDPSHGIHGNPPHESGDLPDTNNGVIAPPLTENPEQKKGEVAVVSDGITVYPKGYMVWASGQERNEEGELVGFDADGMGASWRLEEIKDEIPKMRTAGNDYALTLPAHMSLRDIRAFEIISIENGGTFEQIALPVGSDPAIDLLGTITRNGTYIVVLDIYSEVTYSEDEYVKSLNEYAFWLTVDASMNDNAPVRVIQGDKTYFPTGYLLTEIYYDAELKQEVTKRYDGATYQLQALIPDMVTATVIRRDSITSEDALSLYLAPFYDLREISVYNEDLDEITKAHSTEPLEILHSWDAGDYYVIISAVFAGTGMTEVMEFPFHVVLVEEDDETEEPPVGIPDPPRVRVTSGFNDTLQFGNEKWYGKGYRLWSEEWVDGSMASGMGLGAQGQLSEIFLDIPSAKHDAGASVTVDILGESDTLTRVSVYDDRYQPLTDGADASVLSTLEEGTYVVILTVVTQGDYIEEAEAFERYCTEYAFWLAVYEEYPSVPETNPRVVVSGGGQAAVFETEEDGFMAWRETRQTPESSIVTRLEVKPVASVIFADDEALRALPDMAITYGTPLTLSLDAAGDELYKVILYSAKGEMVAEGDDLSVVDSLENEGWDRDVILVLQVISRVSETETACYEYAVDLTVCVPSPPSGEPVDVMVGSEFILPYSILVSALEWTGSKFDGGTVMIEHLSSFTDKIPTAEYTAVTRVRVSDDHVLRRFEIWDADFNLIKNESLDEYTALDDLHAALDQLSPGTYYLMLKAVEYGQYVESHHLREEWETNYYVALRVS